MNQISIIGIDLAKNLFQLHGAHEDGSVAFRKQLPRGMLLLFLEKQSPCLVAKACPKTTYKPTPGSLLPPHRAWRIPKMKKRCLLEK